MNEKDDRDDDLMFPRRAVILGGLQATAFGVLGLRLFNIQVVGAARYAPLAEENRVNLQVQAPRRGRILDRKGVALAENEEIFRATLTPALAGDVATTLSLFRRIVPISPEDAEKFVKRAKKQGRNTPIVIANDLSFDDVAKINLYAPQLPGIRTEIAWRRRYRQGPAVGHVVGYVGNVDRTSAEDDAVLRLPGMKIGKVGVEAGLETELRGTGGAQKIEVDARGHPVRSLGTVDPVAGADISLTIDANMQRRLQDSLQTERRAAAVVLDVETGHIVAMGSFPSFDPATIVEGLSDEAWQRLLNAEDKPLLNRAIAGQYPPGSTFKTVTALAAMKAGIFGENQLIECTGRFEAADQTFRCSNTVGHGPMTFQEAMRASCDTYFFELARRVGIERLAATARELGLGQTYACGLPEQKAGLIPDPAWKHGRWNADWLGADTILTGVGQGFVLANPLQLAVMTARIATGLAVEPVLIKNSGASPTPPPKLNFDDEHLAILRKSLFAAVNEEGGTGSEAKLGDGRPRVAGKTGTAQIGRQSSDGAPDQLAWHQRDHALFVGYVPAEAPRYAISVIVEHGGGESIAVPVARDVLTAVLDEAAKTSGLNDERGAEPASASASADRG